MYHALYDKIEFTYLSNGQTYINPTAVDCLSLPLSIQQGGKTFGMTTPRSTMFANMQKMFTTAGYSPEWARLIIKDQNGSILRVVAPGRDDNYFDATYLNDYIPALWNYYKTHTLSIDCSELTTLVPGLGNYTFKGQVDSNNNFVFSNGSTTETIGQPTSDNFFLAAQGVFDAQNATVRSVLVRNVCAAWSVGLLPAPDNAVLNAAYYQQNKAQFYNDNTLLPTTGSKRPWYNLYAKAIHQLSSSIYAWAYDDAIGLDGTNASIAQNPATIIIGPLVAGAPA